MLNAIPDNGDDHQTADLGPAPTSSATDPEAVLEAKEHSKYLLAKSFFDCREFDRCAAVFLPDSVVSGFTEPRRDASSGSGPPTSKGKARIGTEPGTAESHLPVVSQKSLFLALYAKFMSGEKRKDEDSEMVMGPQDLGTVINKQLVPVSRFLSKWFEERTTEDDEVPGSQGWLEYL